MKKLVLSVVLAAAGAGEEGDVRPVREACAREEIRAGFLQGGGAVNGIDERVARIGVGDSFPVEIGLLEGEDDEKPVHMGLQLMKSRSTWAFSFRIRLSRDAQTFGAM